MYFLCSVYWILLTNPFSCSISISVFFSYSLLCPLLVLYWSFFSTVLLSSFVLVPYCLVNESCLMADESLLDLHCLLANDSLLVLRCLLADEFLLVLQSSSNPLKVAVRVHYSGNLVEQFIFLAVIQTTLSLLREHKFT
jgi:hypothetical protein